MSKKTRKSFRETWDDDEWGEDQRDKKRNDITKRKRKQAREQKFSDRWFDEDMNLKRTKK